jgi:hypothetical protein
MHPAKVMFQLYIDSIYVPGEGYSPIKTRIKLMADHHNDVLTEVMTDPLLKEYKWVIHAIICPWSPVGGWTDVWNRGHYWLYCYNPIDGIHKGKAYMDEIRKFKIVDAWTQYPKSS